MKRKLIRSASLIISIGLTVSVLAGCGSGAEDTSSNSSTAVSTSASSSASSDAVYPIKTDVTLKYWMPMPVNVAPNYKSLGDTPYAKEREKRTGVKVEYLHPTIGQENEALNILIASGDLPDIIETDWLGFPGGPEQAIQNKIILKANDYLDQYSPNYKKYLNENPEIDKMVKTDAGSYYGFPFIRGDAKLMVFRGIVIRNDWLKELNLQMPATIDEWYTVLKAFKEQKKASAPLSWAPNGSPNTLWEFSGNGGAFVGAFGVYGGFYQEDGKAKYGPIEPGYKEFLATMAKWYKEGLIDKNFTSNDTKGFDAAFLGGQVGASIMNAGGGLGKYIPAFKEKDPNADLQPAPYPTLNKGETPKFGQRDLPYVKTYVDAITASSKNVEIAAKWLDYGYSEEGILFENFGIEGVSYNMKDGYPTMTDEVMKNPKNLPVGQAWSQYGRASFGGPFIQRVEYAEQYNTLPAQQEALKIWPQTDMAKYLMPSISPTAEESSKYAKIINDANTLLNEYNLKVIMGVEPIDGFDKFVSQMKQVGIDEAIAIQQAALDRYAKR